MDYKHISLIILTLASAHPSVDRYITELPSTNNWDYGMLADQPYTHIPARPSSYIYQIDDPAADYIYSSNYLTPKKDPVTFTKRSSSGSSTWTPPHRSNSRLLYRSMAIQAPDMVQTISTMHTPPVLAVINRHYGVARVSSSFYPSEYYDYAGNVYTAFSDATSTSFVQPNVLYSSYLTDSKPVYVVNNPFNGFIRYIYENPKQYAYYTVNQPIGYNYDAIKVPNHSHNPTSAANTPSKVHKEPIETNLTKIDIDPITDIGKSAREARMSSQTASPATSNIIHKQRPIYHNTFGVMFHKLNKENVPYSYNGNQHEIMRSGDILKKFLAQTDKETDKYTTAYQNGKERNSFFLKERSKNFGKAWTW